MRSRKLKIVILLFSPLGERIAVDPEGNYWLLPLGSFTSRSLTADELNRFNRYRRKNLLTEATSQVSKWLSVYYLPEE